MALTVPPRTLPRATTLFPSTALGPPRSCNSTSPHRAPASCCPQQTHQVFLVIQPFAVDKLHVKLSYLYANFNSEDQLWRTVTPPVQKQGTKVPQS